MGSAVFFRALAVIFSKGFGWHDDHFLVIEAAQSWVDGTDYNRWLPMYGNTSPSGHSFFYPGIHFIFLWCMKWIGMTVPQHKMMIIRLIHALLSLIVVSSGYKIAEKLDGRKSATVVGLMLAMYFFMPFLSVRNLVEVACIPFLMLSCRYIILRKEENGIFRVFFIAGVFAGIAMCVRFQSVIFVGGIGLALLMQKKWKETFFLAFGTLVFFGLFQGLNDYLIWGKPFVEFIGYIQYNIENSRNYIENSWYSYLLVILGILIPPVSIFLFFGFFRMWKKHLILFLPSLLFLIFHSYFPNKQERFILPIIPFIIISGVIGWRNFAEKSDFWKTRTKLLNRLYMFSVVINFIALPFITFMYSKRARVESMVYLSADEHIKALVMEDSNHPDVKMAPRFYLKKWIILYEIWQDRSPEIFRDAFKNPATSPDYILFYEDRKLDERVETMKQFFPDIHPETIIYPGFIDNLLYKINPNNVNQTVYIYKTKK